MRFSSIASVEEKFRISANKGEYILKPFSVPIRGEALKLEGLVCSPVKRRGFYHAVEHPKEQVVLHFTAGNLVSDLSALSRNDFHVSVAFVVARDGTIYQLFPSKFWSGHIGKGIGNTDTGNARDKRTIGIELSNYGFLRERDGNLETYYSRMKDSNGIIGPVDIYSSLNDTAAYQKLATPFRGESYYASFTKQQYESTIVLLRYLTAQYNIPRQFLPEPRRYEATDDVLTFKGIVSHINYRKDGKWDLGPAFDWKQVIDGVQSASFQPSMQKSLEAITTMAKGMGEQLITSEEEVEEVVPKPKSGASEDEPYEDLSRTASDLEVTRKKNLYGLLVGINDYDGDILLEDKVRFRALRGCVEDMNKMHRYLRQDDSFNTEILPLANEKATKQDIVKSFREHLSKAGEGDVVLFYFSGHGTQEWADTEVWKDETDGRLECIACYYDEKLKDGFLLSDKELRFLIHELSKKSKAHIITIFDCCHSADNTRNGAMATTAFSEVIEKRVPFSFKKRDWNKFIFSKTVTKDDIIKKGEYAMLPEGMHVQFSACESDESAVEVSGEGVFTKTLLKVLDASGGDVSYYALQNRVRQYLRNVYEQKPRIYIPGGYETMLYSTFLDKPATTNRTFAEVTYNEVNGWQLNLGGIHGIGEKTKEVTIIDEENNKKYSAAVKSIGTDYTTLTLSNELDKKVHKGYVENLMSQTLQVNLQNADGLPEDQQKLFDALFDDRKNNIVFEDSEDKSQYVVHARHGRYYITRPNEPFKPIARPEPASDPGSVLSIVSYLKQISQWEFLKNFSNENERSRIGKDGLLVELYQVDDKGKETILDVEKDAVLKFKMTSKGWKTAIRMKLTNTTKRNLYCSVLHLTAAFGSSLKLLNPSVKMLEPGNSVELLWKNNPVIESSLSEVVKTYNWKEEVEHFKLIVSTELFNPEQHALSPLPLPPVPGGTRGGEERGFADENEVEPEIAQGWTTRLITVRLQNPEYNKVSEGELREMMISTETADFALGIYFDSTIDESLQVSYQVKREIEMQVDGVEKGFIKDKIVDVANWLARRNRNNRYSEMVKRFPNRLRIVSEGDSWFQHPLVLDTIDHLSRVYAVYCVAAAGDTLRNYQSAKKKNGEYYLDALEKKKPLFFLISGGGNDILGSQFRSYLNEYKNDNLPEGENPKRFLKESLFDELKSLMEIYKNVFGFLKNHKPNVHVIVHGYDYPIKLDDPKKGWLGRYMIEKGIRAKDRQAVIHLIMDTFNEGLKKVASEFDNVSYLDVRKTVRFNPDEGVDQWYDEIHPNHEGFQQVAMKFMQEIERLFKEKFFGKVPPPPKVYPPLDEDDVERSVVLSPKEVPKMEEPSGALKDELESFTAEKPVYRGTKTKPPAATEGSGGLPDVRDGQLEYEISDLMEVGKSNTCKIRIAGEEVALDFLKISAKSIRENIKVADDMMVKLLDPSGGENFEITGLNSDWQGIFTNEFTEWNFNVKPKKSGRFPLVLRISIRTQGRIKDTNILEKEVLVSSSAAEKPPTIQKILFMCANPVDTERLKVNQESERIKEALENSIHRDEILFVTNMAATPRNMIKYLLREKPSYVHFSGHGSEDGLYVEDENGVAKPIPGSALDLLFKGFQGDVKCVLFNSCYSESQAKIIMKYIPHVIGMKRAVKDKAASAFSEGFYQAIGAGKDIKPAFDIGLARMGIESIGQEEVPVLLPEDDK